MRKRAYEAPEWKVKLLAEARLLTFLSEGNSEEEENQGGQQGNWGPLH